MKILITKLLLIFCFGIQLSFAKQITSIYNDARLIFHALGQNFHSLDLEGIDPAKSLEVMETTLDNFVKHNLDIPIQMKDCILKAQKSLSNARTNYWACIDLVNIATEQNIIHELALKLSQDVKNLIDIQSAPSILFIGGHYLYKNGSLGGHTATYETVRQNNGKLSFIINNTVKTKNHEINGNRIYQLVYTDLDATDLDIDFWKNVIRTNYMNPLQELYLMESFYDYVDKKLFKKNLNNKTIGRSFKCQQVGVCAWKSIAVWLHGQISPGNIENRDISNELIYVRFKRFMFENMLIDFNPNITNATIRIIASRGMIFKAIHFPLCVFNNIFGRFVKINDDFCFIVKNEEAGEFLKTELKKKIKKLYAKYNSML